MRWTRTLFGLCLLLLAFPALAAAQSDVLTGRVMGQDGRPVMGARVEALSVELETTRSTLTDQNGRYMILFPDGGGRYLLRISFLGMADIVRTVVREDEELLLTNVTMEPQAIALDAINVRAQGPPPGQGDTGEQSTTLSQDMLNRLPLPDLDPNTIALLSAGVIGTGLDSLSGRMGFSVAGMSDMLNQIMLDGVVMGDGGLQVPEEGLRQTRVTTNTFDVSRGGFAGGLVTMSSARGSNRSGGSFSYRLDDDALQMKASANTFGFTRHNFSGSYGGPLIRNRLFYNGSFQLTRNVNHRFALSDSDPLAAQRSGVSADSISRFLNILESGYSMPVVGQTGAYNQLDNNLRLQGRLDWNALQRQGQSHTVSARFNFNMRDQDSTRINVLDLAQRGGETEQNNRLAALSLTSRFRSNWTHSLNLSFSENWNESIPFTELPEGRVRVTSDFDDGTRGTNTLVFGGNRNMPTEAYSRDLQLSNELSLMVPIGYQIHRLKVGGSLQKTRDISRSTDNLFGSFTYASLADFEDNRPDRYERSLTERQSRSGRINAGLFFGDTWRISQPLEVTLGLRWDYSMLDQTPAYNPAVEAAFGRRTDVTPSAWGVSPRIGFSYRMSQQGQPARSVTGGVGLFAGRAPTNVFSQAMRQTGLPDAEQRLICIGSAVPTPDWDLYLQDPMAAPATCADGGMGVPPAFSTRAPNVTLVDPSQKLPSSLRVDLGYRSQLNRMLMGNFRYMYSRGLGLWGYQDINIDESGYFLLANEGRRFFGSPDAIVARTGATSLTASRLDDQFGNVYVINSDLQSETHQLSAQFTGMLGQRTTLMGNYTLSFSRDQGAAGGGGGFGGFGGGGGMPATFDSPNDRHWATANTDRRHTLNATLSHAFRPEVEVSMIGRLSSGAPFSPIVDRDVNGDGLRNDLAFIFDPATTADPVLAEQMGRLLENVPDRVRSCLESQFGSFAERNSCRNGWTQGLDMRASLRPNLPRVERRLTVSVDARNVLTGLDQTMNGRENMRGWGEGSFANPMLLNVRGFDHETNAFRYEINEGFGQNRRGTGAIRNPFALTISARLMIGGQPMMANRGFGMGGMGGFAAMMGGGGFGGRGGFGGGGGMGGFMGMMGGGGGGFQGMGDVMGMVLRGGELNVDSVLAVTLANPVATVLSMRQELELTEQQATAINSLSETLEQQLARRREALRPTITELTGTATAMQRGQAPNPQLLQRIQLEVQPHLEGGRRETQETMRLVQQELSEEQWQKLPPQVRMQGQGGGGRGMGGGMGGGFNAVGMLDRMLANPIPVLLELRDTLQMTPEQVRQIEAISSALQQTLDRRRQELGRRFDNVQGQQQARLFAEIQPEIERSRNEVTDALRQVERILSREQWLQIPEQVRNPFQGPVMGPGMQRRGGGGGGH